MRKHYIIALSIISCSSVCSGQEQGRWSAFDRCYQIMPRATDGELTNAEADQHMQALIDEVTQKTKELNEKYDQQQAWLKGVDAYTIGVIKTAEIFAPKEPVSAISLAVLDYAATKGF